MWKRKKNNRKFNRSHVLDVKLRASQVRQSRIRKIAWCCGLLFGTGLGLYVLWRGGDWALKRFVYENQAFAIEHFKVQTDGSLPVEKIKRWSGVKPRENLFALDISKIRNNLQRVPVIESAIVERSFPDTLRIRVTEREPLAQVFIPYQPRATGEGLESALYLLDANGYVIPPADFGTTDPNQTMVDGLPILVGVNPADLRPGRPVETGSILGALRFISAFERSPMAGLVDILQIDVSSPEILLVQTQQQSRLTFSIYQLDQQLRRWRAVYDFGQGRGMTLSTLDLSVANNLPAIWFDRGAAVPDSPKSIKPMRKSKKHV